MGKSTYRYVEGQRTKIVILGSGNVATHLAVSLDSVADVRQVWSRNIDHANRVASNLSRCEGIDSADRLMRDADVYIIAVVDDAIPTVASMLQGVSGIVAHTSGSFPLDSLSSIIIPSRAGVFYPLQTFSKEAEVNISKVPFLIEGTDDYTVTVLSDLARNISENVHPIDSSTRAELHVAAVFANNFANYVWDLADRYLKDHTQFDIKVFGPLLDETLKKALTLGPHRAQTGPAKRNDTQVINTHIAKLDEEMADVYRALTEHIIKDHSIITQSKDQ